jgi:hypothetical protein
MALDASSTELNVIKPNPLDLPVSRSTIILATKNMILKRLLPSKKQLTWNISTEIHPSILYQKKKQPLIIHDKIKQTIKLFTIKNFTISWKSFPQTLFIGWKWNACNGQNVKWVYISKPLLSTNQRYLKRTPYKQLCAWSRTHASYSLESRRGRTQFGNNIPVSSLS